MTVQTSPAKVGDVDRHGFPPADDQAANTGALQGEKETNQGQDDGAQKVDVRQGIKGDPPLKACRVVSAARGHPGMAKFMARDNDDRA